MLPGPALLAPPAPSRPARRQRGPTRSAVRSAGSRRRCGPVRSALFLRRDIGDVLLELSLCLRAHVDLFAVEIGVGRKLVGGDVVGVVLDVHRGLFGRRRITFHDRFRIGFVDRAFFAAVGRARTGFRFRLGSSRSRPRPR